MYNSITRASNNKNILIDLEKMKGSNINNITQYNAALRSQVIQNQQKNHILKYTNSQVVFEMSNVKSFQIINACDMC